MYNVTKIRHETFFFNFTIFIFKKFCFIRIIDFNQKKLEETTFDYIFYFIMKTHYIFPPFRKK